MSYDVGFSVSLEGASAVKSSLLELKKLAAELNKTRIKIHIGFETHELQSVQSSITNMIKRLERIGEKDTIIKMDASQVEKADNKFTELRENLKEGVKTKVSVDSSELKETNKAFSATNQMAKRGISTKVSVDSSDLKRASLDITNVISSAGRTLENIGGKFGGAFINKFGSVLRRRIVTGILGNVSEAVTRYDTLRRFDKTMGIIGYSPKEIEDSRERLNQAVLGTPTTLDEIISRANTYALLRHDLNEGTELAIAVNDALLASGQTASQTAIASEEIENLLTRGELTSDQWVALFGGLGVSLDFIAEKAGYTYQEYRQLLQDGERSTEEFIEDMKRATADGTIIDQLVGESKQTLDAATRNFKTAITRMIESGVLSKLDEYFEGVGAGGLPNAINMVSEAITKKLTPAVKEWFDNNPEVLTGFFDMLRKYDWGTLISNVAEGAVKYFSIMADLFSHLNPNLVAFFTVWASPLGRALGTIASALRGFKGLGSGIGSLLGKIFGKEGIGGALSGGTMTGLGLRAGSTALALGSIAAVGGIVLEYGKVIEAVGKIDVGNFDKNIDPVISAIAKTFALVETTSAIFAMLGTGGQTAMLMGEAVVGGGLLLTEGVIHAIGSVIDLVEQVATLPETLDTMSKEMTDTNVKKWGKGIEKMVDVISVTFNGIFDALDRNNNGFLLGELYSSDKQTRILNNLEESVGNVSKIAQTFSDLRLTFEPLFRGRTTAEGINYSWLDALKKEFPVFVDEIKAMFDKLTETFSKNGSSIFSPDDTWEATAVGAILSGIQTSISSVKTISDNMMKIEEAMVHWKSTSIAGTSTNLEMFKNDFNLIINSIGEIFDEMIKASEDELGDTWLAKIQSGRLTPIMTNINSAITSIGDIITTLQDVEGKVEEMDVGRMDTLTVNLRRFLTGMKGKEGLKLLFEDLQQALGITGSQNDSSLELKASNTASLAQSIGKAFGGIFSALGSLSMIHDKYGDLIGDADNSEIFKITANLKRFIGEGNVGLSGLFRALSGLSTIEGLSSGNIGSATELASAAMENIGVMMEKLKTLQSTYGGEEGDEAITFGNSLSGMLTGIVEALSGLGGDDGAVSALTDFNEQLGDATSNSNDLKDAVKKMQDEINKLDISHATDELHSLVMQLTGVQTSAMVATNFVGALQSAIDNLKSKSITLSINMNGAGSVIGAASDAASKIRTLFEATGGIVPQYRGIGGILFKPRGTDTVPAMLTPGEYVMKRSAVNAFGAKFMQKVNNLDIDGAFRSLMVRAGSGLISRTMSNVTNNYRDNHSTVNFYGKEGRRGMDYRRAGRYVRAL